MTAEAMVRRGVFRMGVVLLGAGLAATAAAQSLAPQDYPQWRGRDRDGSAAAFTAPAAWPETLSRKWKVEVGAGYATPIVVGNRVYAFTRQAGDEVLLALEAGSGRTIWRTAYPAPFKMNPATKAHGEGPKSTPLFHGGRLFTLGISGIVSAFDASTGKLLWQKPAGPVEPLYHTAQSPLASGDLVILHVGGHNDGALTAFEAATGKERWAWKGDGPAYGSPILATIGGTRQLITVTQQQVVGVDPGTGQLLWQRPFKAFADGNAFTPIIYDGTVITSARDAGINAFRPVKGAGGWSTESLWQVKDVEMMFSNAVVVRDRLYGLSWKNSGQMFALDPRTGQVTWTGAAREATNSAIVKSGDLLFFLNDDAELVVARATAAGLDPLKRYTVAESATWAQPTLSGGRIFVKDVSALTLWTAR